jgi:hypothetical protein
MTDIVRNSTLSDQTVTSIRDVLVGRRRGLRSILLFAGPAVIASIAYMDAGNFATNIQAGAKFGYSLLWVVLMANVIASFRRSPPNSASSPAETLQKCAANNFRGRRPMRCGASVR